MTTTNTEPIPVADALRLCEMALADCDKATPGPWAHENWGWVIDARTVVVARAYDSPTGPDPRNANADFIVLSRAVVRPLLAGIRELLARLNPTWFCWHTSDMYPILSALRDHYDKTRPDWRSR